MSIPAANEQLLTCEDLAHLLRKSVHSIRHDLSRNPRGLPPRCAIPGTNRNLWRPSTVVAWLASHETDEPKPKTRRGGLTNKEKAERKRIAGQQVSQKKDAEPRQKSKGGAPTKAERIRRRKEAVATAGHGR